MLDFTIKKDKDGNSYLETNIEGKALLTIPQLNKGTAFTEEERKAFGLIGKLPSQVETLEQQVKRCYLQYKAFNKEINRNIYLNRLLNQDHVLFYKLVQEHLQEMLPTIYTPIVGEAVKEFNEKFSQPRGLYISYAEQDAIEEILDNRSNNEIKLIVVTDGEGILGIGDQGIGGMCIPIAKLMVYTAFAGINPSNTLPILLDPGTNNEALLKDPYYLGWRHPRLTGEEYFSFIAKFVSAVRKKFPHVFLHWEDFGRTNAYQNLKTYRDKILSFNDDIQGTGVVAVSAALSAAKRTSTKFADQQIIIYGAGTAGMGVADNLFAVMKRHGLSEGEARKRFWLIDRFGLISEHTQDITPAQEPFLRSSDDLKNWKVKNKNNITLLEVIKHVKPTMLIGCSAQAGAFSKDVIKTMAKHLDQPIIFPLSNPTEKAEATPTDLLKWTKGKAIIATGSPFDPVDFHGKQLIISQCNNYLAFPGIGLGVIAIKAKYISDNMLWAASKALANYVPDHADYILPRLNEAKKSTRDVAIAVAQCAIEEGLAEVPAGKTVEECIDAEIWQPEYLPYKRI